MLTVKNFTYLLLLVLMSLSGRGAESENEKNKLFSTDTSHLPAPTSDLFAILDSGISFKGAHQDLSLTTTGNSAKLNSNLQDLFLAGEETL